jgi:hypothetical protein
MKAGDQSAYDLFLSYARKDNRPIPATFPCGWVTAIFEHILADHRQFSTAPLRICFDPQEIADADDWRHHRSGALRQKSFCSLVRTACKVANRTQPNNITTHVSRRYHPGPS